ncbi:hypothetical protein L1077_24145 [Pseudoalteromonas luteoviolacea]|uniref:hypothetical protein n=1 Tax=Pseudoalteromonas luteoviolacea TaxID=43657 RepID=UPI001F39E5B5|nr:hypothetical protein [Pseudoalteromonas luteoviolacea]MCF6442524.1 hypothetical protein [Pseudoalteromonas luteoviolacea]
MGDIKQERKEVYKEVVNHFDVHTSVLMKIHNVSKNVIEKWLYVENRYPPFEALLELNHLLIRLKLGPVKSLERLTKRPIHRINQYLSQLESSPVPGGVFEPKQRVTERYYEYAGEVIQFDEIRRKLSLSISHQTINKRIIAADVEVGQSIDHVDFTDHGRRGPKPTLYIYKGIKATTDDISDLSKIGIKTVCNICQNSNSGDDVTHLINDYILQLDRQPAYQRYGLSVTEYNRLYRKIRILKSKNVSISVKDIVEKAAELGFSSNDYDVIIEDGEVVTADSISITVRHAYFLNGQPTSIHGLCGASSFSRKRVKEYLEVNQVTLGSEVDLEHMKQFFAHQDAENKYINKYVYNGELLTKSEIARRTNRDPSSFTRPFQQLSDGDDVTELVDNLGRKKRNAEFIFNGESMTRSAIAQRLGIDYTVIVNKMAYYKVKAGNDVTELLSHLAEKEESRT